VANHLLTEVFDHSRAEKGDRLVLIVLADQAGKESREAHGVSVVKLADWTRLSIRAVQYSLQRLVKLGEIEVLGSRTGGGHERVPIYRICPLATGAKIAPVGVQRLHPSRVQSATLTGAICDKGRVQSATYTNSVSLSVYPLLEDADASAFESTWAIYPPRFGSNPKRAACRCWQARRKEGHTADEIRQGVERYRAHCTARGEINTEFVMQAKRFFGVEKEFLKPWPTKRSPAKPSSEKILCACGEPYVARYAGTPLCARCYRDKAAVDLPGAAATRP
jgi:hypothetical protein